MKVLLTGTAGGTGWPEPGCRCASCAALPAGHRRPFDLVVDGAVRFPFTGPLPTGYRPHADGLGLTGPDGSSLLCLPPGRPALQNGIPCLPTGQPPPQDETLRLPPGQPVPQDGTLRLPAGQPVPQDGPAGYGLVLIDLLDRPERLGELRRAGLVDSSTQVVAIGLDHRVRSEEELARRLRLWGARAVPDGTELETTIGATASRKATPRETTSGEAASRETAPGETTSRVATSGVAAGVPPRRALLLGGSRSGKSAEAELWLATEPHVTYVATGPDGAGDGEWAARVRAHRDRRPAHWATAETTDLVTAIRSATAPLLIDGLGTWLAAVFDQEGAWEGDRAPVEARCDELVAAWRQAPERIVAVSDEVGLGVVPATASGRAFRDALGRLNARLAAESEYVALVVAGRPLEL
ncbi:bifunctional adenosylcobinamide kinase/adenosylcobinamide-phosphate guanylyltransferase [Nonomuraea solani]|uniref:bifunctional adenosylcobinamide kinase/adenosylcobinamide-phosphate guanylyltransferase n=1 Tax=Nonomuraea solani TaxID=1144553 RepID=UPI000CDEC044|nr:bifunctional adenosylcobinamide kinase/adenosylcobinamide-phosphate guanylyltransferase [Nonomuraea solani]